MEKIAFEAPFGG